MTTKVKLEWELPVTVLEEMLAFEFDLDYVEIVKLEYDPIAEAIYIDFTVDSGDFERIPESTSMGTQII